MASNCSTRASICCTIAHSALQRRSRMMARGTSDSSGSASSRAWMSTKACNSGAVLAVSWRNSSSSLCTAPMAACRRATSFSTMRGEMVSCATSRVAWDMSWA